MSDEFSAPGSATGLNFEELNGSLLMFHVDDIQNDVVTSFGSKDPMRCHVVVVLDGEQQGTAYADTLVFPGVLIGQLRGSKGGGRVLGRLGQGEKKPGQNPPWKLSDPTDADRTLARQWLAANPAPEADPFAA